MPRTRTLGPLLGTRHLSRRSLLQQKKRLHDSAWSNPSRTLNLRIRPTYRHRVVQEHGEWDREIIPHMSTGRLEPRVAGHGFEPAHDPTGNADNRCMEVVKPILLRQ